MEKLTVYKRVIEKYEYLKKIDYRSKDDELNLKMIVYAFKGITLGKKLGINLDFTVKSIAKIEEFFLNIENSFKIKELSDEKINNMAHMIGGYIGEVLIQDGKNVSWYQHERNISLRWYLKNGMGESDLDVVKKVFKRIKYGAKENIIVFLERTFRINCETLGFEV